MQEINDELMMPCAQCARKHLSAAIAHYADSGKIVGAMQYHGILVARALINLCEAEEGYGSHRPFAVGLLVKAEQECTDPGARGAIRGFRLAVCEGKYDFVFPGIYPTELEWYRAHVLEAEREYPDIRTAVEREPFYRDNMSDVELGQAEVNYRLAQLRWLDENVFGQKPVEKGGDKMAKAVKKPAPKAAKAAKGGCKGACKGGKCKK